MFKIGDLIHYKGFVEDVGLIVESRDSNIIILWTSDNTTGSLKNSSVKKYCESGLFELITTGDQ